MSTSVLYHGFGLTGIKYLSTKFNEGQVIFESEMTQSHIRCPQCQGHSGIFRGKKLRSFLIPPIGKKKCLLRMILHRVQCRECSHLYWPTLPFMIGTKRMTRSFVTYALELLQFGTIKDVACHLQVGWDTVKDIHKEFLDRKYKKIDLRDIEYLAIDEFSIKKGHQYMTVVSDLKTGRIIYSVEGRKKEDILPFLKSLKKKVLN